jgi:hypothetical protein
LDEESGSGEIRVLSRAASWTNSEEDILMVKSYFDF